MPLGRNARQARQRSPRNTNSAWTPRVDVFGDLRLPTAEIRCRLIEYAPSEFAAFTIDIENPVLFKIDGDFDIKGRIMTAQIEGAGGEVKFKKAGCGCETPHELRTGRNKLLEHVPTAASSEEPTPDELTAQLQQIPGASV